MIAKNLGEGKFQRMQVFQTRSAAKGVCWADLNNDGELDLLYAGRGTGRPGDTDEGELSLRRGLGNWKFGPEIKLDAGISAYYIETGDINNDDYVDILVPNELGTTVSYWINPGKTVFDAARPMQRQVLATSGVKVNDVRAVDFNGDGHLDVLTDRIPGPTVTHNQFGSGCRRGIRGASMQDAHILPPHRTFFQVEPVSRREMTAQQYVVITRF